uniref:G-protein coupled receptors family 1 profile domain-containing protein n=1 Tax=Chelonoidis abingdonii TaxID=106734 RepID=A0A8C0GWF5_CHEAB
KKNPSRPLVNCSRVGIPGLEAAHIWISIPFTVFYFISLLGNFTVLFVVGKEQTLHKPMYLLLCMLALTDIGMSTSVVPKALCIFWFNLKSITVGDCLTQSFLFHMVSAIQSAVLVIMAFDRYVAICNPLRYNTILTNARIVKLGLVGLTRAVLVMLPGPLLLIRQPFCGNHIIPHTYCEYMTMVKMSCGDITFNRTYGVVIAFVGIGLDLTLIALSYGLIIRTVIRMSSKKDHQKALKTCTAHICVIVISYTSILFTILINWFNQGAVLHVHIILANLYFLVPLMLNPIIYGVKTKEFRDIVALTVQSSPSSRIEQTSLRLRKLETGKLLSPRSSPMPATQRGRQGFPATRRGHQGSPRARYPEELPVLPWPDYPEELPELPSSSGATSPCSWTLKRPTSGPR